jgi:hypothetical protein
MIRQVTIKLHGKRSYNMESKELSGWLIDLQFDPVTLNNMVAGLVAAALTAVVISERLQELSISVCGSD